MTAPPGALLLVLGSAVLFSLKGICAKLLFRDGVPLDTLLLLRSTLSLPVFWIWAARRGDLPRLRRAPPSALALAMFGGVLSYYIGTWCDFRGLELTTASLERALLFTYPTFVVLLRAFTTRRLPPLRVLFALGVTYAGICLAVGAADAGLWRANALGAGLVLVSALTFAIYLLINERLAPRLGSVGYVAVAMTAAAACFFAHFLSGATPSPLALNPRAWLGVVLMTAFTNVLPLLMMAEGVLRIGAQRAAILSSVGPLCTLLAGVAVLGEVLAPVQWLGTAVIVAGVLVLEGGSARR